MADADCIFCSIIAGDAGAEIVHSDEHAVAFMDVMPQSPGLALIVPKAASRNLFDADPAADAERVFERFARVDDARAADAGGTGLGLAIAREIAGRHGGRVELLAGDAAPLPGACFVVNLPAAP